MNTLLTRARRALLSPLLCATLLTPFAIGTATAAPVDYFVPYLGEGNLSVFDAAAGTGAWAGSIDEVADPTNPNAPLSLVSVVLFTLDRTAQTLMGSFQFTTTDLLSTLYGELTGTVLDSDILTNGGQFSVDYRIDGGTGQFARASGFGLAFVNYDPAGTFNNYDESGVLVFTVPSPATGALVLAGLLALGFSRFSNVSSVSRRKARPLN